MAKRTFNEKLHDSKDMPVVKECGDPKTLQKHGGNRMLIAAPIQYDEIIRRIPKGKLITSNEIRNYLAIQHNADFTCQLTAGIFISIAAHASEERDTDKIPYWRTLKANGELNEKYPCGIENQKKLLEQEGHTIISKGKKFFVKDFDKKLFIL
ncbi:MAG: MGMT family protein [Bacteroidales bacterium]|jgi:alkylated DNA nucleotide flippase Atl1|nr:MGMT family protein [Bacteroidales bacterium]